MIANQKHYLCTDSEPYYYDLACYQNVEQIPAHILQHAENCSVCRAEIEQLQTIIEQTCPDSVSGDDMNPDVVIKNLSLHLRCSGQLVDCGVVRVFLSSLADSALPVRIPTPITIHVEKCQQCADDLAAIQQLNLSHKQLCALGQIFGEECDSNHDVCKEAQGTMKAVAGMSFKGISHETLKHICVCPECRKSLYQQRQTLLSAAADSELDTADSLCTPTDIFDYCFPYGIDPANDQYAGFRPAFVSYVSANKTCLEKMQQLHTTVTGIMERMASGIVTRVEIDQSAKQPAGSDTDDVYAEWPMTVEVFDHTASFFASEIKKEDGVKIAGSAQRKKVATTSRFKPLKRTAVAAAILLIALLAFNIRTAKAIDLKEVYAALSQIHNICISRFAPDKIEPIQQEWVSRTLNIRMFKTGDRFTLWDIDEGIRKTKMSISSATEVVTPSADLLLKFSKSITNSFGFMPFNSLSNLPENSQWNKVEDLDKDAVVEGTEVYDLTCVEQGERPRRWRVWVDSTTKLPKKTLWHIKRMPNEDYALEARMQIDYCTEDDINAIVARSFD